MRRTKKQEGITLVALIITIIILLILAAVTIMALDGEDGIIGKSRQAKIDYEKKQEEEKGILEKLEGMLTGGESAKEETPEGDNSGDSSSEGGDSNSGDGSLAGGNSGGSSGSEKEYVIGTIKQENSTINGQTSSSINPIIPAGFQAKNTETSKWDAEGGPEVNKGLVITDGTSEFVWVPVTSTISSYGLGTTSRREPDVVTGSNSASYDNNKTYLDIINNILGTSYNNSNDFLDDLQNDFKAMANSVNNNKGFYVGRYETSLSGGRAQSVKGVTSATAEASSANRWYGLYAYQKAYSTSSVQGSMIWGSQYDAMMTWMGSAANTTISGKNQSRVTGSEEYPDDVIKNVYDLYGNSFEWTLEALYTNKRVERGGNYYRYDDSPSYRSGGIPTDAADNLGSRLTLYIK